MRHVQAELQRLAMQGASDAQIEKQTGLRLVSSPSSTRTPLSTNSADSVPAPKVLYDAQDKNYYVSATWNYTGWTDARGYKAIGGPDGFGIRFSQPVNTLGGPLTSCMTYGQCKFETSYWDNSEYGVAWRFQDRVFAAANFSHKKGYVTYAFKRLKKGCLQVFSTYAHTWSTTSVAGFAINTQGFGISWSKSSNYWQRASPAGKLGC